METVEMFQLYDLNAKMYPYMMYVPKRALVHLLI